MFFRWKVCLSQASALYKVIHPVNFWFGQSIREIPCVFAQLPCFCEFSHFLRNAIYLVSSLFNLKCSLSLSSCRQNTGTKWRLSGLRSNHNITNSKDIKWCKSLWVMLSSCWSEAPRPGHKPLMYKTDHSCPANTLHCPGCSLAC